VRGPIVITGGAGGIGAAVAAQAAEAGHPTVLLDRDVDAVERVAQALPGDRLAAPCDVTDEDQVAEAFAIVADQFGPPRGLVTAAGIDRGGPAHELDLATFDALLAANLRGTFLACREAIRLMRANGAPARGAIVCISSPFAVASAPGTSAYAASKGGVSALVRALAVEYASEGIRVNAVLPGPTETDLMWANVPDGEVDGIRATVQREVPLGRLADPAEPARVALWLLGDHASFITGAQLACDGGVLAKSAVSV
jgi:NAD(P)-dependent dehydrogenase (short-subunit alcohol dehydrogenase family)